MIILKSRREIERMRTSCRIAAEILSRITQAVKPGVTTIELEDIANQEVSRRNVKAAFKGYNNFPYALCCSPNDIVVHGMPNSSPLNEGDILSLDFGVLHDDFYGDLAVTVPVGRIEHNASLLLTTTEKSLYLGMEKAVPGGRLHDISYAIQSYVESSGFSVVRDFVGHGIGRKLHEDPQVPNYGTNGKGCRLNIGMVLAIEPMINEKSFDVNVLNDGWTVTTRDAGLSAHFEHTVAITENGPDILTLL